MGARDFVRLAVVRDAGAVVRFALVRLADDVGGLVVVVGTRAVVVGVVTGWTTAAGGTLRRSASSLLATT